MRFEPNARKLALALTAVCALAITACPSDDESSDGDTGGAGSGGDSSSCTNDIFSLAPSGFCADCVCDKCESIARACDKTCWDLINCMHKDCDANEANLDSCAAGACSEFSAGLSAAKAFAPCVYRSADRGQGIGGDRRSCLISCNYGL